MTRTPRQRIGTRSGARAQRGSAEYSWRRAPSSRGAVPASLRFFRTAGILPAPVRIASGGERIRAIWFQKWHCSWVGAPAFMRGRRASPVKVVSGFAIRWEPPHLCGGGRASPVKVVSGLAIRWEPPHLCGGGRASPVKVVSGFAVRWEPPHLCGGGRASPVKVVSGFAVRWEPPHLCGGGALERSDKDSALFARFSAGQSSVAASTADSHTQQPSSTPATTPPFIPDIFNDSPSGHDFSRAARLANR